MEMEKENGPRLVVIEGGKGKYPRQSDSLGAPTAWYEDKVAFPENPGEQKGSKHDGPEDESPKVGDTVGIEEINPYSKLKD